MRYLIVAIVLTIATAVGATPSRWNNGRIEFAVGQIGNKLYWSQPTFQAASSEAASFSTASITVTSFIPSVLEMAVSTSGIVFSSHQEFRDMVGSSQGLRDKLDDLPPSQIRRFQRSIDLMRSENLKRLDLSK